MKLKMNRPLAPTKMHFYTYKVYLHFNWISKGSVSTLNQVTELFSNILFMQMQLKKTAQFNAVTEYDTVKSIGYLFIKKNVSFNSDGRFSCINLLDFTFCTAD